VARKLCHKKDLYDRIMGKLRVLMTIVKDNNFLDEYDNSFVRYYHIKPFEKLFIKRDICQFWDLANETEKLVVQYESKWDVVESFGFISFLMLHPDRDTWTIK